MSYRCRRTIDVPRDVQTAVARLVRERGPHHTGQALGLGRSAILSLALGQPVERGTLALARIGLAGLGMGPAPLALAQPVEPVA